MNILADATLPGLDAAFPKPFQLTRYASAEAIPALLNGQDILLCRANVSVHQSLLCHGAVRTVATASSGRDHIDLAYLTSQNIQAIDARGCNATSVADYILSCLAYLDTQQLILGSSVGIIGMGHVGTQVHKRLSALGFVTHAYDPLKAEQDPQFTSCSLDTLHACDIICVHAELHHNKPYPSAHLIDAAFLAALKPGCIIMNAARGGIVDEEALLQNTHVVYCTDVYCNEPRIDPRIVARATLCTPHIAGHSLEAKYRAVSLVSKQLHQQAGLPLPEYALPKPPKYRSFPKQSTWQEQVLSLYHPMHETLYLKKALDVTRSFLSVRKNHQYRHDFVRYTLPLLHPNYSPSYP